MSGEIDGLFQRSRLRSLLDHFSVLEDRRKAPKVRYPLREELFLVVAATIADCEDYDEIALWGRNRLEFLQRFSEFHFGTPCADWLRVVMNRIGPDLFQACFTDWAMALRPDAPKLIAIDGKTSRRSHDRATGRKALHLVSAWATSERLVLAQEAVDEKENECAAIPDREYPEFRARRGYPEAKGGPAWHDAKSPLSRTRSSTSCWLVLTPRRHSIRTACSIS